MIKVPTILADYVDGLRSEGMSNREILEKAASNGMPIGLLADALYKGYYTENTSINLDSVYIWKGNDGGRERYKVKIKEINVILSVFKDTHKKTFEKIDNLVQEKGYNKLEIKR